VYFFLAVKEVLLEGMLSLVLPHNSIPHIGSISEKAAEMPKQTN